MEALQALKLSSRNGTLNLTEHLSDSFYPPEDDVIAGCEVVCSVGAEFSG